MIAFVRGDVAAVNLTSAVLDVGGVGLELMCTPGTLATLPACAPDPVLAGPTLIIVGEVVALAPREDRTIQITTAYTDDIVRISLDEVTPAALSGWSAYPLGVVWALR